MEIAYLIIAHKNIEQIATFINLVTRKNDRSFCFLHLDDNLGNGEYTDSIKKLIDTPNYQILENRVAISWGGFNMVEASLRLIKAAVSFSKKEFDYLALVSGADLPLKSNEFINDFLSQNSGNEYLQHFEVTPYSHWSGNGGLDRTNFYWFMDDIGFLESQKLYYAQKTTGNLYRPLPQPLEKLYGGSQWWTLTRACAAYILQFITQNPAVKDYFRFSFIPDESFFQTIVLNSVFQKKVVNNNFRLIDWNTGPQYPKVFTVADEQLLMESEALIARKFDIEIDKEIIEIILKKHNYRS
ncbi:MAG: hypothetical protein JWR50_2071 [Mucilaginibacter sp.]|nr:hypothetical protein [Mucilaginibacter sp.]